MKLKGKIKPFKPPVFRNLCSLPIFLSCMITGFGIGGNVPAIILTDGGEFKLVGRAGDPGDIAITGGQSFIMTAQNATTITISGDAWAND